MSFPSYSPRLRLSAIGIAFLPESGFLMRARLKPSSFVSFCYADGNFQLPSTCWWSFQMCSVLSVQSSRSGFQRKSLRPARFVSVLPLTQVHGNLTFSSCSSLILRQWPRLTHFTLSRDMLSSFSQPSRLRVPGAALQLASPCVIHGDALSTFRSRVFLSIRHRQDSHLLLRNHAFPAPLKDGQWPVKLKVFSISLKRVPGLIFCLSLHCVPWCLIFFFPVCKLQVRQGHCLPGPTPEQDK